MVPFVSDPKVGTIPMLCPQTCWAWGTPSSATHLSLCPLPAPCRGGVPDVLGGSSAVRAARVKQLACGPNGGLWMPSWYGTGG